VLDSACWSPGAGPTFRRFSMPSRRNARRTRRRRDLEQANWRLSNAEGRGRSDRGAVAQAFPTREAYDAEIVSILRMRSVDTSCSRDSCGSSRRCFSTRSTPRDQHPPFTPPSVSRRGRAGAASGRREGDGCTVHFVTSAPTPGRSSRRPPYPCSTTTPPTRCAIAFSRGAPVLPAALQWLSEGRVRLDGSHVRVDGARADFAVASPPLREVAR